MVLLDGLDGETHLFRCLLAHDTGRREREKDARVSVLRPLTCLSETYLSKSGLGQQQCWSGVHDKVPDGGACARTEEPSKEEKRSRRVQREVILKRDALGEKE